MMTLRRAVRTAVLRQRRVLLGGLFSLVCFAAIRLSTEPKESWSLATKTTLPPSTEDQGISDGELLELPQVRPEVSLVIVHSFEEKRRCNISSRSQVALLFITRGPMVHEALWRDWLRAAHGVIPAEFAAAPPELALPASQLDSGVDGSSMNSSTHDHKGAAVEVVAWVYAAEATCVPRWAGSCAGAKFVHGESAAAIHTHLHSHDIACCPETQLNRTAESVNILFEGDFELLQVYIHPPPAFKGYPRHSVFADSVVPNRVEVHVPTLNLCIMLPLHNHVSKLQTWPAHSYAACAGGRMVVGWHKALLAEAGLSVDQTFWGSHGLVQAHRSLLTAALQHPGNTWFMTLGDASIPLYPPQLMSFSRQKSRNILT